MGTFINAQESNGHHTPFITRGVGINLCRLTEPKTKAHNRLLTHSNH